MTEQLIADLARIGGLRVISRTSITGYNNARKPAPTIARELRVDAIIEGSVVSEVDVETPHGIVTSVITTRSIKDLDLKVGSEVIALVKSTEVSIAKIQ